MSTERVVERHFYTREQAAGYLSETSNGAVVLDSFYQTYPDELDELGLASLWVLAGLGLNVGGMWGVTLYNTDWHAQSLALLALCRGLEPTQRPSLGGDGLWRWRGHTDKSLLLVLAAGAEEGGFLWSAVDIIQRWDDDPNFPTKIAPALPVPRGEPEKRKPGRPRKPAPQPVAADGAPPWVDED